MLQLITDSALLSTPLPRGADRCFARRQKHASKRRVIHPIARSKTLRTSLCDLEKPVSSSAADVKTAIENP